MENRSEIILYQTTDGATKIDVRLEDETVWLNQNQLETLFQTDRTSIVKHIKNMSLGTRFRLYILKLQA